jgi:hypothetical protein
LIFDDNKVPQVANRSTNMIVIGTGQANISKSAIGVGALSNLNLGDQQWTFSTLGDDNGDGNRSVVAAIEATISAVAWSVGAVRMVASGGVASSPQLSSSQQMPAWVTSALSIWQKLKHLHRS